MAYAMEFPLASQASESARAAFIRRTYAHLAGAILAFVALETMAFTVASQAQLEQFMGSLFGSPWSALILLFAFIGVGWLARWWAYSGQSLAMQYAGLSMYVVFQAVIFVPILYVCTYLLHAPNLIMQAGILTLCVFGGLTVAAFTTRKDFSFLAPILCVASLVMFGAVICAIIFGLNLGLWYSLAAITLACGFILYDTSNVIHHFRTDQHVAAALELFASVAYLFYYILRLLMQLQGRD
jgi:FtsH-binding integral membrane protein